MTYQVIIRPSAEEQLTTAYLWYEDKSVGLGDEFILSVDACIQYIARNPFSFQARYKEVRIGIIHKFPYGIFYLVDKNKVIVLAVLHFSQNPAKWKKLK